MNYANVVTAFQDIDLITVLFPDSDKEYTYKAPPAWQLQADDTVVVDSPSTGLTLVKVVRVEHKPVDVYVPYAYKWVVQGVFMTPYEMLCAEDAEKAEQLSDLHRKKEMEAFKVGVLNQLGKEAYDILRIKP